MPVVAVVGAALGVVVTGLALLVVTVLLCLFWRRRRRKSRELAQPASDQPREQNSVKGMNNPVYAGITTYSMYNYIQYV